MVQDYRFSAIRAAFINFASIKSETRRKRTRPWQAFRARNLFRNKWKLLSLAGSAFHSELHIFDGGACDGRSPAARRTGRLDASISCGPPFFLLPLAFISLSTSPTIRHCRRPPKSATIVQKTMWPDSFGLFLFADVKFCKLEKVNSHYTN